MPNIAFVNMCSSAPQLMARGRVFDEPVHLLPMHNIALKNGLKSMVFQYGYPTPEASIRQIRSFGPDMLGLSFVGGQRPAIVGAHKLISSMKITPHILIGGSDPTFAPGVYAKEFGKYGTRPDKNLFFIVQGKGEAFVAELTSGDPDPLLKFVNNYGKYGEVDGHPIIVLSEMPVVPLDKLEMTRPYNLSAFSWDANVRWAGGCFGKCKFCPDPAGKIDYRSPKLVLGELKELKKLDAETVRMASADFTADPDKASEMAAVLPTLPVGYAFESRVDSFYRAIKRHPAAWKRFANIAPNNQLELGVESFIPERLARIGKYQSLSEAKKHEERLIDILKFFKGTNTIVRLFLIHLDWMMDLNEALREAEATMNILTQYGGHTYIDPDTGIGRPMRFEHGSHYSQTMEPVDFLKFARDPRLFLLYCRIEVEKAIAREDLEKGLISAEEIPIVTMALLDCYLGYIKALKEVDPRSINLDKAIEWVKKGKPLEEVTEMLIRSMGIEGKKLEEAFSNGEA